MLSAGLSVFTNIIELFAMPHKVREFVCAALVNSVIDCKMQNWEELTAPAFDALNHLGPLRKNKNSTIEDISTNDISPFQFERFKRHLHGVLDRVCRLAASDKRTGTLDAGDSLENIFSEDYALEEEEDDPANAEIGNKDLLPKKSEEESDWVCDVKQTMEILPRL